MDVSTSLTNSNSFLYLLYIFSMKKIILITLLCLVTFSSFAQLNKPYFYQRGRELIIEGKFRQAIESLNILLRSQKDDYEGFFLRGIAKYNLDDLSGARADFGQAIHINESYTSAYQYRAITHSRMGLYNEAISDFEKALSIRPSMAGLYYSRGVTYFLNQQFDKAITDFDQFVRMEPRDPSAYINRGTSYLYLKDTVKAIANYNRAIEVNPYHSDGYMRRGMVALMRGKYAESIPDLDKTIELSPDAAYPYFYRGMAFAYLDKVMMALEDFDNSIMRDSSNSVTFFNRAMLRSQIGDLNRAIDDYSRVARSNPNNVLVFYNRAHINVQIGAYKEAIADYSRAIELYPDFANAYLYRANVRQAMGDINGSMSDSHIAKAKITEYRSKLNDSTFSIYADTSKQFNQIMSFDADFGSQDFIKDIGDIRKDVKLLPMYRFTFVDKIEERGLDATTYQNQRIESFIKSFKMWPVDLTNKTTGVGTDTIMMLDKRIGDSINIWSMIFAKSITQAAVSQFNSSLNYLNFAIDDRPTEPFAYINRGVTQAQMVEFIESLDGDYQNVTIDMDPAARLKKTEKRKYDYSSAIKDMQKAAELMPELPHIYFNIGNLMCMNGDMPSAIKYYTKAIELFPYFGQAYFNRGLVQIYLKDNKTGCLDMSKAGELGIQQAYSVLQRYCTNNKKK